SLVPLGLITRRAGVGTGTVATRLPVAVSTTSTTPLFLMAAKAVLPSLVMATSVGRACIAVLKKTTSPGLLKIVTLLAAVLRMAVSPVAVTIFPGKLTPTVWRARASLVPSAIRISPPVGPLAAISTLFLNLVGLGLLGVGVGVGLPLLDELL